MTALTESNGRGSWTRVSWLLTFLLVALEVAWTTAKGVDIQPNVMTILQTLIAASAVGYSVNKGVTKWKEAKVAGSLS